MAMHEQGKTVLSAQEARQGKELGVMRYGAAYFAGAGGDRGCGDLRDLLSLTGH